jgi:hypothetical protein
MNLIHVGIWRNDMQSLFSKLGNTSMHQPYSPTYPTFRSHILKDINLIFNKFSVEIDRQPEKYNIFKIFL